MKVVAIDFILWGQMYEVGFFKGGMGGVWWHAWGWISGSWFFFSEDFGILFLVILEDLRHDW